MRRKEKHIKRMNDQAATRDKNRPRKAKGRARKAVAVAARTTRRAAKATA